jgi:hypothetical protein
MTLSIGHVVARESKLGHAENQIDNLREVPMNEEAKRMEQPEM